MPAFGPREPGRSTPVAASAAWAPLSIQGSAPIKGSAAIAITAAMQKAERIASSEGSHHPHAPAESPAKSRHNFRATTMAFISGSQLRAAMLPIER
jgi:hypothetical protein